MLAVESAFDRAHICSELSVEEESPPNCSSRGFFHFLLRFSLLSLRVEIGSRC